jgi:hypothetical protein
VHSVTASTVSTPGRARLTNHSTSELELLTSFICFVSLTALTDSKRTHIPFRDSTLTFLLKDSLGGNTKTTLLVSILCSRDIATGLLYPLDSMSDVI